LIYENVKCRWSAIAGKLPGRTDNEIKNVWNTHLKKRVSQQDKDTKQKLSLVSTQIPKQEQQQPVTEEKKALSSPQCASTDVSTLTTSTTSDSRDHNCATAIDHQLRLPVKTESLDDDFWSQVLSPGNAAHRDFQSSLSPLFTSNGVHASSAYDNVNFWYDVYMGEQELRDFWCWLNMVMLEIFQLNMIVS